MGFLGMIRKSSHISFGVKQNFIKRIICALEEESSIIKDIHVHHTVLPVNN
jgi:hypothetical protein